MKKDRAQRRIDEIIEATTRCIAEKGYENLTMHTISEYSGLSRGAINHYFKRKEDILISVLNALDRKLFKLVDDRVRSSSDVEDKMRYRLSVTLELFKNDPVLMYVMTDFIALAMNNPIHGEGIKRFFNKYRYLSSVGVKPGLESGKYREVKPEVIGVIVMAVIIGVGIQWILDKGSFEYDGVIKSAEEMIMLFLQKKN